MEDATLLELSEQGFIPGPQETEEAFIARIERMKSAYESQTERLPQAHWDWVKLHLESRFGFQPTFVTAFYSDAHLTPWQGAAIWLEENGFPLIQLRTALRKGSYLGLYRREEILAHEAVHAARAAFLQSRFEEFFAYMTAENRVRQVLGPIIDRPWEVWPFIICLGSGSLASLGIGTWEGADLISLLSYLLAFVWLGLGLIRLIRGHWLLQKASQQLIQMGCSDSLARTVLFRLTDEEIQKLAKGEPILKRDSLRERLVRSLLSRSI